MRFPLPVVVRAIGALALVALSPSVNAVSAQGAAGAAGAAADAPPAASPADVASADAIIAALYDVISGPAGQKRDWNRFRSLFAPGARLIPTGGAAGQPARALVWTPEEYVQRAGAGLEAGGFFERELGRTTEQFGRIMHAFSTYDSKRKADDAAPFMRGINSIQLLNDGTRWWILSVFWDSERPDNPIPAKYLTKGSR